MNHIPFFASRQWESARGPPQSLLVPEIERHFDSVITLSHFNRPFAPLAHTALRVSSSTARFHIITVYLAMAPTLAAEILAVLYCVLSVRFVVSCRPEPIINNRNNRNNKLIK